MPVKTGTTVIPTATVQAHLALSDDDMFDVTGKTYPGRGQKQTIRVRFVTVTLVAADQVKYQVTLRGNRVANGEERVGGVDFHRTDMHDLPVHVIEQVNAGLVDAARFRANALLHAIGH